jgi:hypothetical protein
MKKRSNKDRDPVVASVTVNGAASMDRHGRHNVALWLRRTANLIEREGHNLSEVFDANLYVTVYK